MYYTCTSQLVKTSHKQNTQCSGNTKTTVSKQTGD